MAMALLQCDVLSWDVSVSSPVVFPFKLEWPECMGGPWRAQIGPLGSTRLPASFYTPILSPPTTCDIIIR